MRTSINFALSISAAVLLLAGCGGSQPPAATPGAIPRSRAIGTDAGRDGSWMLPEARSEDLLYVSNSYPTNSVTVYSYQSHKLVGSLIDFSYPGGICVDKASNVFVANEDGNDVLEYAHGGTKPIESLPDADGPIDCSVDTTTGNLAVANAGYVQGPPGSLYVYKNARGIPTDYTDGYYLYHFYGCVYDSAGNLFVDGSNGATSGVALAELPKGGSAFTNIRLSPKPGQLALPGGLGWDGKHVTLYSDTVRNVIYRLTIRGNRAHHRQHTSLEKGYPDNFYWILLDQHSGKQILIGADNVRSNEVLYWNYPAGGNPIVRIRDGIADPAAAAVSLAPQYSPVARLEFSDR